MPKPAMFDKPLSGEQLLKSDQRLLDRAFKVWGANRLHPSLQSFAREVLVRNPRTLRRWREGLDKPLPKEVRVKLKELVGDDE